MDAALWFRSRFGSKHEIQIPFEGKHKRLLEDKKYFMFPKIEPAIKGFLVIEANIQWKKYNLIKATIQSSQNWTASYNSVVL